MQMSGALKEDWTPKNWGYYDDFMMIFVSDFVRWLNGLEAEVDVMQFDRVLEAAEPTSQCCCISCTALGCHTLDSVN